tara:strand:+ start:322 stop:714 length:393 start_codon:yes stop_codon:yes gene_type:complete
MNKIIIIILIIIALLTIPKINKMITGITKRVNPLILIVVLILIIFLIKDNKLPNIESFSQENTNMTGMITKLYKQVVGLQHSHGVGGPDKHTHEHTHRITGETVTSTPEPLTPEPLTPEPLTPEPEAFTF